MCQTDANYFVLSQFRAQVSSELLQFQDILTLTNPETETDYTFKTLAETETTLITQFHILHSKDTNHKQQNEVNIPVPAKNPLGR